MGAADIGSKQLIVLDPTGFFATFVLGSQLVQQIMRWDMAVLEQSPWYQEILQQGVERGLQQGVERGLQQSLLRILHRRFGAVSPELPGRLQTLHTEQLELID